jgi:ribonuclease P protein component
MPGTVIKENRIFRRLYSKGKHQVHPLLVTYVQRNREGQTRYGISASKKIGCAVERNRAKRVIRAAYREVEGEITGSWDFIFVARSRTTRVKMNEVKKVMERQIKALTAENGKSGKEKRKIEDQSEKQDR